MRLSVIVLAAVLALALAQEDGEVSYNTPCIFFGDRSQRKIWRVDLDGENRQEVVSEGVGYIHSLIVDQGGEITDAPVMYWTDTLSGEIKSARGDGNGRVSTITAGLLSPRNLFMREIEGEKWLYYNEGAVDGIIGRVKIDGSGQEVVHDIDNPSGAANAPQGYYPSVMTLDEENNRIYYVTFGFMSNLALRWADLEGTSIDNNCVEAMGRPPGSPYPYEPLRSPRALLKQPGTDTLWISDFNRLEAVDVSNCGGGITTVADLPPMNTAIFQVIHQVDENDINWMYYTEGLEVKEIKRQNLNDTSVPPETIAATGLGSSPAGLGFGRYSSASGLVASFAVVIVCAFVAVLGAEF